MNPMAGTAISCSIPVNNWRRSDGRGPRLRADWCGPFPSQSPPLPSEADRCRGIPHQLMLILSGQHELRAWWLEEDRQVRPLPIDVD